MSLTIDETGLVAAIRYIASPNCDERPAGSAIELLVIHNISLPPGEFGGPGIIDLFTNKLDPEAHPYYREIAGLRVSAHFLIRRDGEFIQFVPCDSARGMPASRAGAGAAAATIFRSASNSKARDDCAFEDAQYGALAELTRALQARYPITDIVGHADIAPARKTDPGPCFDWARYRKMLKHP